MNWAQPWEKNFRASLAVNDRGLAEAIRKQLDALEA